MTPPLIDARAFEALQANAGADFVLTLIQAFADEAPQLLAELSAAAVQADAERFETAAHTFKSNSLTFGASRLAESARRLEWQGPVAGSAAAIAMLTTELTDTLAALQDLARH